MTPIRRSIFKIRTANSLDLEHPAGARINADRMQHVNCRTLLPLNLAGQILGSIRLAHKYFSWTDPPLHGFCRL